MQAISLFEQTLTDRGRLLGEEHPDMLSSANNLAGAHESAGRLEQAISLYEQILTDCRRLLGEEHPLSQAVAANRSGQEQRQTGHRVDADGAHEPGKKRRRCTDRDP